LLKEREGEGYTTLSMCERWSLTSVLLVKGSALLESSSHYELKTPSP
jgi:hypothetical protein